MNLQIPVYIERIREADENRELYDVRPLFAPEPQARNAHLNRAIATLVGKFRKQLDRLGQLADQRALAEAAFSADVKDHRVGLRLHLDAGFFKFALHVVSLRVLDRRVAFSPRLPGVWFEIARGESVEDRAKEVYGEYFARYERDQPGQVRNLIERIGLSGKAWTTMVDIEFESQPSLPQKEDHPLAALFGRPEKPDGGAELDAVGRCLDWLYPSELDRVALRDREVEELSALLGQRDRRQVLLVGPPAVGKTALIHEYVYRTVDKRKRPFQLEQNTWLLAPQRLISGMSYVGQWEDRLLAILQEAKKRNHVLYFDNLVGLFRAGISRDSNLSVAQVMKPYLERREIRVLGEITPDAFRVLQELDRGFADLFHVLRIAEPSAEENLKILLHVIRELEWQHRCRLAARVLPTVLDLMRRYVRESAFPGKAARFLRQLAVKFQKTTISGRDVLQEFHYKSGLALGFLDDDQKLPRDEIVQGLRKQVIGQQPAVSASADVISIAKARLNDAARPLASFLFLGPTGVGKTQCAKAVASYLFGSSERMLRFDMNEYVSAASVSKLAGTLADPEGLLTSAIRRQPFAVVLLDEIEKAHPDAFDLLLQVLGEGRLTDALGRTADFTTAIIIMTSNLGSKQAARELGFAAGETNRSAVYEQAARKFFRPEFYNRIDRVIPFQPLSREEVGQIARLLMDDVFSREGLVRRKCFLQIDDRAMERVIDQGYHPQLGARALKRAIERQLTQPVGERLSTLKPETATVIRILEQPDGIGVHVQPLEHAELLADRQLPQLDAANPRQLETALAQVAAVVRRVDGDLAALRPQGAVTADSIDAATAHYYLCREKVQEISDRLRELQDQIDRAGERDETGTVPLTTRPRRALAKMLRVGDASPRNILREMYAADDIQLYLKELAETAELEDSGVAKEIRGLQREAALLHDIAPVRDVQDAVVAVRPLQQVNLSDIVVFWEYWRVTMLHEEEDAVYPERFPEAPDGRSEFGIGLSGAYAYCLLRSEEGIHLFVKPSGEVVPVEVRVYQRPGGETVESVLRAQQAKRSRWLEDVTAGRATPEQDPFPSLPVIRVYAADGLTLDLRTGLAVQGQPKPEDIRRFILATLPLPPEFAVES